MIKITIIERYNLQKNSINKYKTMDSAFDNYIIARTKGDNRYILNISEYNTIIDNITQDILSALNQATQAENFQFTI